MVDNQNKYYIIKEYSTPTGRYEKKIEITENEIISILGCENSYEYFTKYFQYEKDMRNKLKRLIKE